MPPHLTAPESTVSLNAPAPVAVPGDASTPPFAAPTVPIAAEPTFPADAPVVEPASEPAPAHGEFRDGTYLGWGYSRHGDIQASVVIENGHIVSAEIAQCRTRYSCSWVDHLPQQIVSRQRAEVDFVSGATQSSYAFEDAVTEALSQAK